MVIRSKTPLRLGLGGGGTDISPYCDEFGGVVLSATISLYCYAVLETLEDDTVHFTSHDKEDSFTSNASSYLKPGDSMILHKGVYNRIIHDFHRGKPLPIRLTTFSDAPPGSGLGSSSTLVVTMIKAFAELLNLPLGEYDIAHLAYEIERIDLGLPGGKQDQYAAAFGGFNFIEFYANDRVIVNPLRIKNWIMHELEMSTVLCFTNISRDSDQIIAQQRENAIRGAGSSLEAMHELKKDAYLMKEALVRGDFPNLFAVFGKSWEAKKRTARLVSNSDIEEFYRIAINAGAFSGKVSGAGGGGFMMFFVSPENKHMLVKELVRAGGTVIPFVFMTEGAKGWKT